MNWHTRYKQQAAWTRSLRQYILDQIDPQHGSPVLEVGCGTGAILSEMPGNLSLHGIDINLVSLEECRTFVSTASLVQGNALQLPYADHSFEIVYSHFLLLWVSHPLQALLEMKRVTRAGGFIAAFGEPDYTQRMDEPEEFIPLGRLQTQSLIRQGADPGLGARLANLFFEAGITLTETGTLGTEREERSLEDWEIEWEVIESDLEGVIPKHDIREMKRREIRARMNGSRVLHVPTYFAWGRA